MADFVICLYNPVQPETGRLPEKACEYILEYQSPDTVCGYVRNIGREGEDAHILTLSELEGYGGRYVYNRLYRQQPDEKCGWENGDTEEAIGWRNNCGKPKMPGKSCRDRDGKQRNAYGRGSERSLRKVMC